MSHIAVILVPVVDPQLAAKQLTIGSDGNVATDKLKHVLGPYDEAALENALALRDAVPGSTVTALVFGGAAANEALRYAMALKVDKARWIAIESDACWDASAIAQIIADTVLVLENQPDVILMGPELGDHDDGAVPPLAATLLHRTFFSWAYKVAAREDALVLSRDSGDFEERLITSAPVLATVSTHPSVRLRLPLIKNIMAANRQQVENEIAGPRRAAVALEATTLAGTGRKRGGDCQMLQGNTEEIAAAFARLIRGKTTA